MCLEDKRQFLRYFRGVVCASKRLIKKYVVIWELAFSNNDWVNWKSQHSYGNYIASMNYV